MINLLQDYKIEGFNLENDEGGTIIYCFLT